MITEAVPEEETNSEERGRRWQVLTSLKWKLNNRPFKRAIIHFPAKRSCGDTQLWILNWFLPDFAKLSRIEVTIFDHPIFAEQSYQQIT